jgi:tripartite ATP-independent transporter DctP family solute receptor
MSKNLLAVLAVLSALAAMPLSVQAQDYPEMTIKFGDVVNHNFAYYQGIVAFKNELAEKSKGKIKVEIFTDGALGNFKDILQATRNGTIQMSDQATPVSQSIAPLHAVFDLPFLFKSRESWKKVAYGPLGDEIGKTIESQGVKFLGFANGGGRGVLSRKPIKTPDDLKGMKVRVLPDPLIRDAFIALGAQPASTDPAEMYTALQQGVVDALDLTVELTTAYHLNEVGKYFTETKQILPAALVIANMTWWNSLNADTQKLIQNAVVNYFRPVSDSHVADIVPTDPIEKQQEQGSALTKVGVTIVKPDIEAFVKATAAVREKYRQQLGPDIVDRIMKAQGE